MIIDSSGDLYICDTINNRVLGYNNDNTTAFIVYGQPDFLSGFILF